METKFYENGIVEIIADDIVIKEAADVYGLFSPHSCSAIIIKKENIIDGFYDLSTGIAGEVLQKISNYRKRMAIVGDFKNIKSKALRDFIYESNRWKQVIFVNTLEEALKLFA
jgi:hypothetical protein